MSSRMPALSLAAIPGRRNATIELATEIERRGFSGIYGPSLGDSMALCQALAFATNEITFGTSIMPLYFRQVVDFASTASFIHETSGGRFRFGIGVSHGPMLESRGLKSGKPLSDTRQFVEDLRKGFLASPELREDSFVLFSPASPTPTASNLSLQERFDNGELGSMLEGAPGEILQVFPAQNRGEEPLVLVRIEDPTSSSEQHELLLVDRKNVSRMYLPPE